MVAPRERLTTTVSRRGGCGVVRVADAVLATPCPDPCHGPPSQAHAVFVGTRPDGGEHASIQMSGSPTYAWYAHAFEVCT